MGLTFKLQSLFEFAQHYNVLTFHIMGLIYAPSCSIKCKHQQLFSDNKQKKHRICCVTVIADI